MYLDTTPNADTIERSDAQAQLELDQRCLMLKRCAAEGDFIDAAEALAIAAGVNPTTGERYYTLDDVLGWLKRADEMGAAAPRLGTTEVSDVFYSKRVPNAKLREEYERRVAEGEEALVVLVARAIGAVKDGKPDTSYALRVLGVEATPGKRKDADRYPDSLRIFVSYEQAVAIAKALDLDFHTLGI